MEKFTVLHKEISRLVPSILAPTKEVQNAIIVAENALQVRLPNPLQELYAAFGTRSTIFTSFNHILLPTELYLAHKAMVIVEEAEHFYRWAVLVDQVSMLDPPVFQGSHDSNDWIAFSGSLECFLANTICWQALNLSTTIVTAKCSDNLLSSLSHESQTLQQLGFACSKAEDTISLIGENVIIVAFPKQDIIYIGGTDSTLQHLQQKFHLSLNWL